MVLTGANFRFEQYFWWARLKIHGLGKLRFISAARGCVGCCKFSRPGERFQRNCVSWTPQQSVMAFPKKVVAFFTLIVKQCGAESVTGVLNLHDLRDHMPHLAAFQFDGLQGWGHGFQLYIISNEYLNKLLKQLNRRFRGWRSGLADLLATIEWLLVDIVDSWVTSIQHWCTKSTPSLVCRSSFFFFF